MASQLAHPSSVEEKEQATQATQITPSRASTPTVATHVEDDIDDEGSSVNAEFEREAYGPEPGDKGWDKYEVRIPPDDPDSPFRMSRVKRWYITMLGGVLVLNAYVYLVFSTRRWLTLGLGRSQVQHRQASCLK